VFYFVENPKKPQSGFIIITAGESRSYRYYTIDNRKAVAQKRYIGVDFVKYKPLVNNITVLFTNHQA